MSGIQGIQAIMTALANTRDSSNTPLTDRVTFATMNVFGRNLNNISKLPPPAMGSPGGRDHFGNHNVMVMIGKNIKSSVIGGVSRLKERWSRRDRFGNRRPCQRR